MVHRSCAQNFKAYVTFGSGGVSGIDTSNNTVTATVCLWSAPRGVVVTPDGRRAYAAEGEAPGIALIDTNPSDGAGTRRSRL